MAATAPNSALNSWVLDDLKASGLTPETISLAQIADDSDPASRAAHVLRSHQLQVGEGYVIPYPNANGFYRIRLREANIKYIQQTGQGNHIYLPPNLPANWESNAQPLIITEGEKKALKACQEGFPTVAVGGVNSWRSRTFSVPQQSLTESPLASAGRLGKQYVLRLNDSQSLRPLAEQIAPELLEIDFRGRPTFIVFDSDFKNASSQAVQQAAFELALWLEDQGAQVGQIRLPLLGSSKQGLDDFLLQPEHHLWLREQLQETPKFPAHPLTRKFVSGELNADTKRSKRRSNYRVARAIIGGLDSHGQRYRDRQGNNYFFDQDTLVLHQFLFEEIGQTSFGDMLFQRYGISRADKDALTLLADQFTATPPCPIIVPHKVVSNTPSSVYLQLSDSKIARVTADNISILNNGTDDQLFLGGAVRPLDLQKLRAALANQGQLQGPLWYEAIKTTNIQPLGPLELETTRKFVTALFYLSPWLHRWRGTQLPLEIAVAEPNSGKTFLYNLRKGILTGTPSLQGLPNDFRAFVSSLQSTGGLWVCDNLGHVNREYWERLNDELARLITDPQPEIELRQLYTTSNVAKIPVQCSFAVTSIRNPLTKPDLIQRSIIFELAAIPMGQRNSNWYTEQLARREQFIAEHLRVLHLFMKRVEKQWNPNYLSSYRLVNFEQSLFHMLHVLGFGSAAQDIIKALPNLVQSTIAESDVTMQGLVSFAEQNPHSTVQVSDVCAWAVADMTETYSDNRTLTNAIRLGRYIKGHLDDVQHITGMTVTRRNNTTYLEIP